jgi:carbon-monoxide dehydrogenase small subunit
MRRIALTVNGKPVEADAAPRTHLADFLREQLNLTGTHLGCEHGICGACTIVMDGAIVRSCITYAVSCDGADIKTIEAFDEDAVMARLREAFSREHALQCGYCTPGMLISARDLLLRKTGLDETDIRREMAGNLCRCTGYIGIIRAIYGVMSEGVTQADGPRADGYLGPAPGPGARGFIEAGPVAAERAETGKSAPLPARAEAREAARPAIDVIVGQMSQTDGFTEIPQHFILPHPPEKAWLLLSDLRAAAAAMPGAELDEGGDGERISGRMSVRLGPIRPSFAGEARVTKDAAARRVEIEGAGRDKRGASTARGRIAYRLSEAEGGAATRVDVVISYKLSGMLAQFGRPDLVRDVVRRLAANFAQNIDARLAGVEALPAGEREGGVNLLALIWSIVTARVASFWRRATGRAQPPR